MFGNRILSAAAVASLISSVSAQLALVSTISGYRRLGACPALGCIFPPDNSDFLAGQHFDLEIEAQAPVNGTEAYNNGVVDNSFYIEITTPGGDTMSAEQLFGFADVPALEHWNFTYFEDKFAEAANQVTPVNVAARVFRDVYLAETGAYTAVLHFNNGEASVMSKYCGKIASTTANWVVRDLTETRQAKNVLMFIGDGMSTAMITAARLIAHKTLNGIYESRLAMDDFDTIGLCNVQSLDSFITDSANAMTALMTGHKSTVNSLGVQRDSNPDVFHQPKFETIPETFRRLYNGAVGIVSTAFIADATPAGLVAHTRDRLQWPAIIEQYLNGVTSNYSWTEWDGPQVLFGGGAENFYGPNADAGNSDTYHDQDYYDLFADAGYNVVMDRTDLLATPNDARTLGIFSQSNMPVWLDRNVYTDNLNILDAPDGTNTSALDLPGLKDMTLKAIDILEGTNDGAGWFMMSEAASIDKQFHIFDYDRALGDLLELDDTIRATIQHLEDLGILDETLILITADHAQGYDVAGDVDTAYLHAEDTNSDKRSSIGVYAQAQDVGYLNGSLSYPDGEYFPASWDPRYTLYEGIAADTDLKENYSVHQDGPRVPTVNIAPVPAPPATGGSGGTLPAPILPGDYAANPEDGLGGFITNGSLPVSQGIGVHSLSDVPVYAMGPCASMFVGSYDNTDIFFAISQCMGLSRSGGSAGHGGPGSSSNSSSGSGNSSSTYMMGTGSSSLSSHYGTAASSSMKMSSSSAGSSASSKPWGSSPSGYSSTTSSMHSYATTPANKEKRGCGKLGKCGGRYGSGKRFRV